MRVKTNDPGARWKNEELGVNITGAETCEVDGENPVVKRALEGRIIVPVKDDEIPAEGTTSGRRRGGGGNS